jgi:hypothetical protein
MPMHIQEQEHLELELLHDFNNIYITQL